MQPAQKKSGNGALWAIFGCLGCFGLFVVVGGAVTLAFFLARKEEVAAYGPIAPADPYVDPYADPLGGMQPTATDVERYRVPVLPDDPRRGPESAPITIVEFGDFQCPFTARAASTMRDLERQYPGQLRFVWKDNPLPFHTEALPAAVLAREARAQRGDAGFWAMHDALFARSPALSRGELERYAAEQGLDLPAVRRALDGSLHGAAITASQGLAEQIGATGTPMFYVNGRPVRGAQPIASFQEVIDDELPRALSVTARGIAPTAVYDELTRDGLTAPAPEPARPAVPAAPDVEDPNRVHAVPIEGSPQRGPDDALVTIVAFTDYQCPFCARVQPTVDRIFEEYGNDVRLVIKQYPLPFHQRAQPAAEAAADVRAQRGDEAFFRMHALLFENQRDLSDEALVRYARQAGASGTGVSRALSQGTRRADVQRDTDLAQRIGGLGTPTFFINGKKLSGAQPFEAFQAAIDRELADARSMVAGGVPRAGVYDAIMARAY